MNPRPSAIEVVANARLALQGSQMRLQRLLAGAAPQEAELMPARREIARTQAILDQAEWDRQLVALTGA